MEKELITNAAQLEKYSSQFNEKDFWKSLGSSSKKMGKAAVRDSLTLYYAAMSPDVSAKDKGILLGALAYAVLPIDLIPDFLPVVGFADDALAIGIALKHVNDAITPEVKAKAEAKANEMFGEEKAEAVDEDKDKKVKEKDEAVEEEAKELKEKEDNDKKEENKKKDMDEKKMMREARRAVRRARFPFFRRFLILVGLIIVPGVVALIYGASKGTSLFDRLRSGRSSDDKTRFNLLRGWNVDELPEGMKMNVSGFGKKATIDAAGIEGLVTVNGRLFGGRPEFSFKAPDEESAKRAAQAVRGARAVKDKDGNWTVQARRADDINDAAGVVFSPRTVDVKRNVTTVRQYYVDGCKDYEEACRKFKEMDEKRPVNIYMETEDNIGGDISTRVNGEPLDVKALPVGQFLITERETESFGKEGVLLPSNTTQENIDLALERGFVCNDDTRLGMAEKKYVNIYPDVGRNVDLDNGDRAPVVRADKMENYRAFVLCDNPEKAMEYARKGKLPDDMRFVVVPADGQIPGLQGDMVPMEIKLTDKTAVLLAGNGNLTLDDKRYLAERGYSEADVARGALIDSTRLGGGVNAGKGFTLMEGDATLYGVDTHEISKRMSKGDLSPQEMKKWAEDARQIQSVTFNLDEKNGTLRVTSVVNGTQVVEERPLDKREMKDFKNLEKLSAVERKDILMQMHPDYFKSYATPGGQGIYKDPLGDALKGRKPEMTDYMKNQKNPLQPTQTFKNKL